MDSNLRAGGALPFPTSFAAAFASPRSALWCPLAPQGLNDRIRHRSTIEHYEQGGAHGFTEPYRLLGVRAGRSKKSAECICEAGML
jgi:hypothetical protein